MTPPLIALGAPEAAGRADALLAGAVAGRTAVAAWTFARPALVLGSAQQAGTVDAAACVAAGLAIGRRGTGGGAVVCDGGLLEVDVALPAGHPLAASDVTTAYRWLGERWRDALAAVGVATRLVGVDEARAQPDERRAAARLACWAGISPYELLAPDGRKLVGLAQRRRGGATLYQCAVACAGASAAVADLLVVPDGLVGPLAHWLGATVALGELAPALGSPAAAWAALGAALAEGLG